jgi:hypothetical protein
LIAAAVIYMSHSSAGGDSLHGSAFWTPVSVPAWTWTRFVDLLRQQEVPGKCPKVRLEDVKNNFFGLQAGKFTVIGSRFPKKKTELGRTSKHHIDVNSIVHYNRLSWIVSTILPWTHVSKVFCSRSRA